MTKKEELREQYEEALFALLMDAVAEHEGAKGIEENERLRADPAAAVPEAVDRQCMRIIRRGPRREGHTAQVLRRAVTRVAVAALIAMLLFATAFAASPELRARTISFIMEVFDDRTEFRLEETETSMADYTIETGWLPEGMELVEEINGDKNKTVKFRDPAGAVIRISLYKMDDVLASVDTEDSESKEITVQGEPALITGKGQIIKIVVKNRDNGTLIKILGENVAEDDLLLVAENLTIFSA